MENPEVVSNFRPISLCNVNYKIISKILVSRIKPLLDSCISKNQRAFAPRRSIQDNILIAHEIFVSFKSKKGRKGAMAIKLDLEKAYDFLGCDYIKEVLSKFGFNDHWIKLIMECITSTSFSILINGKSHDYFCSSKGIRQGDPLSPYIFILCMEPLIRHLDKLGNSPKSNFGVLTAPRGYIISNLLFADDCLIFAHATGIVARNIARVLEEFANASGQKINYHKSSLYFSNNTSNNIRNDNFNILAIQHKTTIGRYLGIHNIIFWWDQVNSKELIIKIKNKLAG